MVGQGVLEDRDVGTGGCGGVGGVWWECRRRVLGALEKGVVRTGVLGCWRGVLEEKARGGAGSWGVRMVKEGGDGVPGVVQEGVMEGAGVPGVAEEGMPGCRGW